ncbi:MAG: DUF1730 domain-containing protein [Bacteroidales bacterium]|nr:DUF1730 domain-containing protein [Bacteroidales bacterium]
MMEGNLFGQLNDIALALGFSDFGAARMQPLGEPARRLDSYLEEGRNAGMEYMGRNVDKRKDPSLLLEASGSVLCFVVPYGKAREGTPVASFALGVDYHKVIKDRLYMFLQQAGTLMETASGTAVKARVFVDSAPVMDRAWAVECGLGFFGCNNFFISTAAGIRCLIGIILCNVDFKLLDCMQLRRKKHDVLPDCGMCGNCVRHCPTGALKAPYTLDAERCISYHTVESRTLYEPDARPVDFAGYIFGCEECMRACPWDRENEVWPELVCNKDYIESLTAEDWKKMSEEEFEKRFSGTSLTRAGLQKIKNNC